MNKENIYLAIAIVFAAALVGCVMLFSSQTAKQISTGSAAYAVNDLGPTVLSSSTSVTTRKVILAASATRTFAFIQNGAVASNLYFDAATQTPVVYLAAYGSYTIDSDNLYMGDVRASSTAGATVMYTYTNNK